MLKTLKDLFETTFAPVAGGAGHCDEHALQLATAVLLVEVMRADAEFDPAERTEVLVALRDKFKLRDDEAARLVEMAHQTAHGASDFFQFTSRINESFDMEDKIRMVEHLWRVAYADGVLNAHENHLMRRISDLLHVPHGAYINAKLRAKKAAGLED
jgi:uncharacterized tellurite resistance protein B-like protein